MTRLNTSTSVNLDYYLICSSGACSKATGQLLPPLTIPLPSLEAIAMRVKLKEIVFANGAVIVDLYNISFKVKAIVNIQPANREAGSSQGLLLQGEEMTVERVFTNAGQVWVSGKNPRGQRVDLNTKDLLYVEE